MQDFEDLFKRITATERRGGHKPLHWQTRLYERFCRNEVPGICDLPTGLGKTSVIHLWLLALRQQMLEKQNPCLPRRLVYVVDRRTVVDQATEIAIEARRNLASVGLPDDWLDSLVVSTLRGQYADNREWTTDPSRPAIVIGTVDMIGSRLLFSGYRSSYKCRPLDAGLLGQDTLLVLDEAHLSEPFEKLVRALSNEGEFQSGQGMPLRVMCMSATTAGADPNRFKLEPCDLEGDPDTNPIIRRYEARKWLSIETVDQKEVRAKIAAAAVDLATDNSRVVVFVRQPDDADAIAKSIEKHHLFSNAVAVLTGTMRGLERDELLDRPVLRRFLDGEEKPENRVAKDPAILVCTSAGEVGFDLNADHMVCDAAPLDSMIQRLGRVNRRGHGEAAVRMFATKKKEGASEQKKRTIDAAVAAAIKCLQHLAENEDGRRNASPKALDELKAHLKEQWLPACTPKPETVELTGILLDAWSMTTVTEPMPGRPPVGPWLRGLDENEEPRTTIAWRAELDLGEFTRLDTDDIEEWFDAHRILAHETLSVPVSKAAKWIIERWDSLAAKSPKAMGARSCVIDKAGLKVIGLENLVKELRDKRTEAIAHADIIMPASFGGIKRGTGLLDAKEPGPAEPELEIAPDMLKEPDVADEPDGAEIRIRRYRHLRIDGEEQGLVGEKATDTAGLARFALDLPCDDDVRKQLISLVRKQERLDFGTRRQKLWRHVGLVRKHARDMAQKLALSPEIAQAVNLAAAWHDRGKDRAVWQRAAGHKAGELPLGKSGGSMQRIPGNYRHEFGSLREFADEYEEKISSHVFELAVHLIATHHGRGRPHFPKGGFDPSARAKSPQIAADTIRRFARLQRKYGYWRLAYLENLLRCADAAASAENK